MTNDERIALSNRCAELYGVPALTETFVEATNIFSSNEFVKKYLIDDWSRLMPLAVEHKIFIKPADTFVQAYISDGWYFDINVTETVKDHPTKDYAVQAAMVRR